VNGSSLPAVPPALVFAPPFGLRSAFTQSILATKRPAAAIWRRRGIDLRTRSTAATLDCGDGVRLVAHHAAPLQEPARGLVVLIHGWEGSHESNYLYSMACALHAAGHEVWRLNLRDHGGTHDLNEDMFHSARIGEVIEAVKAIEARSTSRPLTVIGFSLGGNFSLRVGLHGPAAGLRPALCVGISPMMNPDTTLRAIDEGSSAFRGYFIKKWHRTLAAKELAWPGRYDFTEQRRFKNFIEMTRHFVETHTEYSRMEDYFDRYTLTPDLLHASPTPLAIVTSADDAVIPIRDFDGLSATGSVVAYDRLDRGGHCGFVQNWRLEAWTEARVSNLLSG
jgi:predicted alpha/beta-fold hydrolase